VVACGPLGFLPEGIGEGAGVGGHGAGQAPVGGLDAEVAGEVAGVVPGGRADGGRLGRVEDGGVAIFDAAQYPLVLFLGVFPSKTWPAAVLPAPRPSSSALATSGGGTSVRRRPACRISSMADLVR